MEKPKTEKEIYRQKFWEYVDLIGTFDVGDGAMLKILRTGISRSGLLSFNLTCRSDGPSSQKFDFSKLDLHCMKDVENRLFLSYWTPVYMGTWIKTESPQFEAEC